MNKPTVKVDAILFAFQNPLELCQFYQRAFDLTELKWFGEDHVGTNSENVYLGFDKMADVSQGRQNISIWFKVDNVDRYFESLQKLGAKAKKNPDSKCSPGETLAELYDPEGNTVGLIGP